jgi:hypothetical protein
MDDCAGERQMQFNRPNYLPEWTEPLDTKILTWVPTGSETKGDCFGEGQQQISRKTNNVEIVEVESSISLAVEHINTREIYRY